MQKPAPVQESKQPTTTPTIEVTPANVIRIGKKPVKAYVAAALEPLLKQGSVILQARGRNINTAVDVEEYLKNRYNAVLEDVKIGTAEIETKEGRKINRSTIEIRMAIAKKK
jgi:DNA-binding protein Alba